MENPPPINERSPRWNTQAMSTSSASFTNSSVEYHLESQRLDNKCNEMETCKWTLRIHLPSRIALFVYNYAKLSMLQIYYDFIFQFFDCCDFRYCEMDTDRAYIVFSNSNWLSVMKSDLREKYLKHPHLAHFSDTYEPDNQYSCFTATVDKSTLGTTVSVIMVTNTALREYKNNA